MRSYLHQAILETMRDTNEPMMAHELKDPVTEKMGVPISSKKIGMHLIPLCEEGTVRKKVFQKGYAFYWIP